MKSQNTAILAIDPMETDENQIAVIVNGLKRFYGDHIPTLQPLYVLNPNATPLPLTWFDEVSAKLEQEARERFQKILQKIPFVSKAPVILVNRETSPAAAVESLNQYALQTDASLAVVATSGKTGLNRVILGSFAEAMILKAKIPLLTISPEEKSLGSAKKRTCLCAIDFLHDDPALVMKPILAMAQQNNFEIILFTATPSLGAATHWAQTIVLKELQSQLQRDAEEMESKAQAVVQQAQQMGINARIVREEAPRGIPEAIAEVAERDQVAFIAIASKTKKEGFIFTGSITRKLVRMATCPIWIIPPSAQE